MEKNLILQEVVKKIKAVGNDSRTEEDLKIGLEWIFKEYFKKFNIDIKFKHEVAVYNGRIDSIYQSIVIEYKKPHGLEKKQYYDTAVKELKKYIRSLIPKIDNPRKLIGVAIDGFNIVFVRTTLTKTKIKDKKSKSNENFYTIDNYMLKEHWDVSDTYEITEEVLENLFLYFRSLKTKILNSETITEDFGLKSQITKKFLKLFYTLIVDNLSKNSKLDILFTEWSRIFGIVYGQLDVSKIHDEVINLENVLDLKNVDFKILLYSIHSYLVVLMKFLSAELLMLNSGFLFRSFVKELKILKDQKLKSKLIELESGKLFNQLGIRNYVEGDFFNWYLDLWNPEIAKLIRSLSFRLSEYEPATTYFEPAYTTDLLKELYQYLIPKKLRRDLGEFYTPDWLADLAIESSNYNGDINQRILDPACGSGTFLVRIIKKIREEVEKFPEKYPNKSEILYKIVKNINGFDINPLAIISARTNYILALGDLLRYRIHGESSISFVVFD